MKYPKLWDGATPLGEASSRVLSDRALPVGTRYAPELLPDGSIGQSMAKRYLDRNDVHRTLPESTTAEPYISTWQGPLVTLTGRYVSTLAKTFAFEPSASKFTEFVGNSAFVGDGFSVGVVSTSATAGLPATIAPLLMRLPRVAPGRSAEDYAASDAAVQARSSRLLDEIAVDRLDNVYVVPMGWKNDTERYTFAVMLAVRQPDNFSPFGPNVLLNQVRIWLGCTGEGALREVSPADAPSWAWPTDSAHPVQMSNPARQITISSVTCTGPGRLEVLILKPESNTYDEDSFFTQGKVSGMYAYPTITGSLGDIAAAGLPPPVNGTTSFGSPTFIPQPYESFVVYGIRTLVPRRPSVFLATSTDFGETWSTVHRPELEAGTREYPRGEIFPRGSVPTLTSTPSYFGLKFVPLSTWEPVPGTGGGYSEFSGISRLPGPIPVPTALNQDNRAPVFRPPVEVFTLVGAGATTFAVMTGKGPVQASNISLPVAGDFYDLLMNAFRGPGLVPYTRPSVSYYAPDQLHLYRRVGGGSFARCAWPLDGVTVPNGGLPAGTTEWLGDSQRRPVVSWVSTGDGRAAFFLVRLYDETRPTATGAAAAGPNEVVTIVATPDGGNTWITHEVEDTENFGHYCVVAKDSEGESSIVFAVRANDPERPGRLQLMRLSADFTEIKKYGGTYNPGRGGLVNYQKYVHPGYPGEYDGPENQPKT